jgi:AraC-like DNA-binding protein
VVGAIHAAQRRHLTGFVSAMLSSPSRIHPGTSARLVAPSMHLSACVRAYVVRSTLGVVLTPEQRLSHFPAGAVCAINWIVAGVIEAMAVNAGVVMGSRRVARPGDITFSGLLDHPAMNYDHGPTHMFSAVFHPDALHALTGMDMPASLNRVLDARTVLPACWLPALEAIQQAPNDDTRIKLLEAHLAPLWTHVQREHPRAPAQRFKAWSQGLAIRASAAGWGRSLRQSERRIKAWTGLNFRKLQLISRAEQTFFDVLETDDTRALNWTEAANDVNWSEVARRNGYSDQAHFCREVRAISGLSPTELRRAVREDESYWIYRVWM